MHKKKKHIKTNLGKPYHENSIKSQIMQNILMALKTGFILCYENIISWAIHLDSRTVCEEGLWTLGVIERAVTHAAPRRSDGQLPTVKHVPRTVPVLGRFIHDLQQHKKLDTEKEIYIYNSHLCARQDGLRNANAVTSKAPLIKCFSLKGDFSCHRHQSF